DVASAVNGRAIQDPSEMKFRMATVPLGDVAKVEVLRSGKKHLFDVEAIAPPDEPPRNETPLAGRHMLSGAVIGNMNPAVAVELGMAGEADEGVIVMKTAQGS